MLFSDAHPVVPSAPTALPSPKLTSNSTLAEHTIDLASLSRQFSQKQHLGRWIRTYVARHGVLLLKGAGPTPVPRPTPQPTQDTMQKSKEGRQTVDGFAECPTALAAQMAEFENFCRSIGTLIPHNPDQDDFVWPIRPRVSGSSLKTFSEHNEAAPLHTDSQYRPQPERFVAMRMLRRARCGGGDSELLDFGLVQRDLEQTEAGRALLQVLQTRKLPIGIPSIFREPGDSGYIEATILGGAVPFRYRYDTMKAGLTQMEWPEAGWPHTPELLQALDRLDDLIQSSPYRLAFQLDDGDSLLVDNHRFLHGRTAFTDPDRLLLRVRFD